jgi:rhamnosyltransferase
MAPTKCSVIIPTHNAATLLEALVASLNAQNHPPEEIIIVDSASTDGTAELASRLGVKLISIEANSFDHGGTRNLGAATASADILIFITQDALPANSETIGRLISPLQQNRVVVSYARQLAAAEATPAEQFLRLANYPPQSQVKAAEDIPAQGIKTFQNSNVCAAYRRLEFESLGRFPAPVVCNEDMIFAARAIFSGFSVAYSADALVCHTHHLSPLQLFRRYFDIAASLQHEPRIQSLGRTETKGFEFLKNQIAYLRDQRKFSQMPRTLLETVAKYCGYKAGANHNRIPPSFKKHLGSNSIYWQKMKSPSLH